MTGGFAQAWVGRGWLRTLLASLKSYEPDHPEKQRAHPNPRRALALYYMMCTCGDGCMGCLLHKSPCRCGWTRKYFACRVRYPWNDAVLCLSRSFMRLRHAETPWQYRLRLEVRRQQRRKKRAVDTAAATAAATATTVIASVCAHRSRWSTSMTSCSLSFQPHNIVLRATHLRQAPTSVVRRQWCRLIVAWPTSKSSCYPSCRQERSMRGGRVSRVQQPVGAGRP